MPSKNARQIVPAHYWDYNIHRGPAKKMIQPGMYNGGIERFQLRLLTKRNQLILGNSPHNILRETDLSPMNIKSNSITAVPGPLDFVTCRQTNTTLDIQFFLILNVETNNIYAKR